MMRALVTGGAGFVGRHVCKALLEKGWQVVCVDPVVPRTGGLEPGDWPAGDPRSYDDFHFHKMDCREYFRSSSGESFDYTFHLAAMVGGRLMIDYEPLAVAEDLAIDAGYWRWAEHAKPGKTVYFSSSAAYPIGLQRAEGYRLLREDDIDFGDSLGMPEVVFACGGDTALQSRLGFASRTSLAEGTNRVVALSAWQSEAARVERRVEW